MIRLLYLAIAAELFLGGGGRLLDIGPMTVRMVLFSVAVCIGFWMPFWRRPESQKASVAFALVWVFATLHLPVVLHGIVRGSEIPDVLSDVQPLLYWLIAPFFACALLRVKTAQITATVVRYSGLVLALGYLSVLGALTLGYIDFVEVRDTLDSTGEFLLRGDSLFFYKGFVYLGIAFIFFLAQQPRMYQLSLGILGAAMILTLTRGFVLSTSVSAVCLLVSQGRRVAPVLAVAVAGVAALMVWVYIPLSDGEFQGQRLLSDAVRFDDITFIADNTTAASLLFGHGFGTLIGDRLNIENTYLWLFWKGGCFTLLFWLVPFALCAGAYRRVPSHSVYAPLARAYFFSVVLIYIQTVTNPYLNNPIGLSFVLIAMFALRTIAHRAAQARSELGSGSLATCAA